ncbi:MAG: sigma-70 family RNA polymerase sigma factor [candidate division FCPU426 bacterium]
MPVICTEKKDTIDLTDMELIQLIRNNVASAADQLADRYYRKVLNTCLRYFRDLHDARDAAQEVFSKVLGEKKILNFRGQSGLWTWLFRITANTCKTHLTKRRRLPQAGLPENLVLTAPGNNLEEQLVLEQQISGLRQALKTLPKKYRRVIYLIYWKRHSYSEAARRLNIPAAILGVRLLRGKHLLSKISRPWLGEDAVGLVTA